MFDDWLHVLARLGGGALAAIVPAFISRGVVNRVCEFRPRLINTYVGFAVGALAAIAWERVVLSVRDLVAPAGPGQAIVLGWLVTWSGGATLIILSVAYFVRDSKRRSIGLASGVIVTLLTFVLSVPVAIVVLVAMAFMFMPRMHAP